ncbi:MAG TPA: PPK2 family polyphosphate kinase [Gemmatimonadaceae bacterium]|nr:PPK2 family polyphosphate kinase [Gemmatimonadaceae bacterium]
MKLRPVTPRTSIRIGDRDARRPKGVPRGDELKKKTKAVLERLTDLQERLYAESKQSLLVVLQGRDTCGKDGTIRRVFDAVNPQGCVVTTFKKPSELELSHDYLWRIHHAVPAKGTIGIFNRSHYEDVLVVRVRGLVPRSAWAKRYDQINDFERMLTENGVTILKFFLHISREEQKDRLLARLEDPSKQWKFKEGDVAERELWDGYTAAYRDTLKKCSTPWAPWYIVPANKKKVRDYLVAQTVVDTLTRMAPRYPKVEGDIETLKGSIT